MVASEPRVRERSAGSQELEHLEIVHLARLKYGMCNGDSLTLE